MDFMSDKYTSLKDIKSVIKTQLSVNNSNNSELQETANRFNALLQSILVETINIQNFNRDCIEVLHRMHDVKDALHNVLMAKDKDEPHVECWNYFECKFDELMYMKMLLVDEKSKGDNDDDLNAQKRDSFFCNEVTMLRKLLTECVNGFTDVKYNNCKFIEELKESLKATRKNNMLLGKANKRLRKINSSYQKELKMHKRARNSNAQQQKEPVVKIIEEETAKKPNNNPLSAAQQKCKVYKKLKIPIVSQQPNTNEKDKKSSNLRLKGNDTKSQGINLHVSKMSLMSKESTARGMPSKPKKSILDGIGRTFGEIRNHLIQLCRKRLEPYNIVISDFSNSWSNGSALCSLIHSFRPELIDLESIKTYTSAEKLTFAQKLAIDCGMQKQDFNIKMMFKNGTPNHFVIMKTVKKMFENLT